MEPQRLVLEAVGMDHPQEEHDPLFQRTWESCVASMDVYLVNGGLHGSDAPGSGADLAELVWASGKTHSSVHGTRKESRE
jgi:hypothetical protein